jgi:hypothetical protein
VAGTGKSRYIREQITECGKYYREVDIFPVSERQHRAGPRAKKRVASSLAQQNANAARSLRLFVQKLNCNFDRRGFHAVLSYDDFHLPDDEQAADRDLRNYLRRLQAWCRRQGWADRLKWMAVTEHQEADPKQGLKEVRYHHHLVIQMDGLTRSEREKLRTAIEDCWATGRGETREALGTVNADRLQPNENGLEALAKYLLKYPKRKKRWRESVGLADPVYKRPNDSRWSRKRLAEACTLCVDDRYFWEQRYPGYRLLGVCPTWDEERAEWRCYIRLMARAAYREEKEDRAK